MRSSDLSSLTVRFQCNKYCPGSLSPFCHRSTLPEYTTGRY